MMEERQPSKVIEYAWGATAAEHAEYNCNGIPFFQRGRFLTEPPEVSQHIPQFRSVQVYEQTDSNGVEGKSGLLYRPCGYDFIPFDLDAPDPLEAIHDARRFIKWLELYGVYDYSIYWSGSKGIHITLPWTPFNQPYLDYTPAILKTLVERYISVSSSVKTFDTSVYNNRALFRMSNTRNAKTGFYKIPLTRWELFNLNVGDIETMSLTDRPDFIDDARPKSGYSSLISLYQLASDMVQMQMDRPLKYREEGAVIDSIPFVEEFIEAATLIPGTRHQVSLTLAAYFRARGYTHSQTEEALTDFMRKCTGSNTPISQRVNESKNDIQSCYTRDVRFSYYRAKEIFGG